MSLKLKMLSYLQIKVIACFVTANNDVSSSTSPPLNQTIQSLSQNYIIILKLLQVDKINFTIESSSWWKSHSLISRVSMATTPSSVKLRWCQIIRERLPSWKYKFTFKRNTFPQRGSISTDHQKKKEKKKKEALLNEWIKIFLKLKFIRQFNYWKLNFNF